MLRNTSWRRPATDRLPDASYIELVTLLLSGRLPIAVMVFTIIMVGSLAQVDRPDARVTILAGSIIILLIVRCLIVTAFIHAARAAPLVMEKVRTWEVRYVSVVLPYAALLGLLNFQLVATGASEIRLLVVAETFGFCAGIVARGFARPQLCALMLIMGAVPTALGFFVLSEAAAGSARLVYVTVGSVFMLYAVAALETISHLYRAILDQLATKRELGAFARVDPLTGLANRLAMREKLLAEESRPGGAQFALLLIDLDGFKPVNDRFGHPAGDRLLREVGRRLTAAMRGEDLAARLGGDEFCVIQTRRTTAVDAEAMANRLIEALARPFSDNGHVIQIGSSIGIALEDGSVGDIDKLVERADSALYRAKRYGGNTVRFWHGSKITLVASPPPDDPLMPGQVRKRGDRGGIEITGR